MKNQDSKTNVEIVVISDREPSQVEVKRFVSLLHKIVKRVKAQPQQPADMSKVTQQ